MVNNRLHVEKTIGMLFIELWTCRAYFPPLVIVISNSTATIVTLFLDHNRKSNFRHPL
jgi:hypothetical protein